MAITARVLSFEEGLKNYEQVELVRIRSKDYNLLILKDYMPVIGEVEGKVEIVMKDRTQTYEEIQGYYLHSSNEFELLITGEDYVG